MNEISLGDFSKIGIIFMFQCFVHRLAAKILRCPACPSLLFNLLLFCSGLQRNFCNLHLQPALGSAPKTFYNAVGSPPELAHATCIGISGAFHNLPQLLQPSGTVTNHREPCTGTARNPPATSTPFRNDPEPSGPLHQNRTLNKNSGSIRNRAPEQSCSCTL